LLHTPAYGLMAFLVWFSLGRTRPTGRKVFIQTFWICFLYGVLIEILQGFVTGRHPSFLDIGLNTIGMGLVLYLIRKYWP